MEHKGCGDLTVHALGDALSLVSGDLAAFLNFDTAWELYCTGKYAELLLRKRVLAGVLLRFRMKQVSAMDCFKQLIYFDKCNNWHNRNSYFAKCNGWLGRNFRLLVHELASVLQKGLEFHERSPCPLLGYSRYHANQFWPESCLRPYELTSLPKCVELTWHPSLRKVGILMVTKKQMKRMQMQMTDDRWQMVRGDHR